MSDKKKKQLGMNPSTASNRLRKLILFDLIKKLELDVCYQCKQKIEKIEELSIEHKIPWLDSEDPKELFFSLENIAFSHLSCNSSAKRNKNVTHPSETSYKYGCRCDECKKKHAERMKRYRNKNENT